MLVQTYTLYVNKNSKATNIKTEAFSIYLKDVKCQF